MSYSEGLTSEPEGAEPELEPEDEPEDEPEEESLPTSLTLAPSSLPQAAIKRAIAKPAAVTFFLSTSISLGGPKFKDKVSLT